MFLAGKGLSSEDDWSRRRVADGLHVVVAVFMMSFDMVDCCVPECALGRLELLGWFRWVHFGYHAGVLMRVSVAPGPRMGYISRVLFSSSCCVCEAVQFFSTTPAPRGSFEVPLWRQLGCTMLYVKLACLCLAQHLQSGGIVPFRRKGTHGRSSWLSGASEAIWALSQGTCIHSCCRDFCC